MPVTGMMKELTVTRLHLPVKSADSLTEVSAYTVTDINYTISLYPQK